MKIKPEILLIKDDRVLYEKILITGSDLSFVDYMENYFVTLFKKQNYHIDASGITNPNEMGGLFSNKKILFFLKNYSFKNEIPDSLKGLDQAILISSSNNKKAGALKADFTKSKTSLLVECYALNKTNKEIVINNFVEKNNMSLTKDVFWYLLENFENEYVLLKKQLELLCLFKNQLHSIDDVEKVIFEQNKVEINKIFFHILKSNKAMISTFNKNIFSQGDFYIFLNSIKSYLAILGGSSSKDRALARFPKYLFNEKDVFIKIYNYMNKHKVKKIYNNILKVEKLTKKHSNLYSVIGLRFLINTKKIITS